MLTLYMGENSFEIAAALTALTAAFDGQTERLDGHDLEPRDLPDVFMGATLFAPKRLIIIRDSSTNPAVWEKLPDWAARLTDDTHIVLVETKPDKRTTTYKALKQSADVKEFPVYGDRDQAALEGWLIKRAAVSQLTLDRRTAQYLIGRVGPDQWQLDQAIEKLILAGNADTATIDQIIEPNLTENVFQLFELALEGKGERVVGMLRTVELTEEPYRLFALLSSQAFQLAALSVAGPQDSPSKQLAIHPFVAGKLARHAARLGVPRCTRILKAFAAADADLKRSRGEPWLVIEKTLLLTARA